MPDTEELPWIVLYLRMSDVIQEMSIEDQRDCLTKFFAGKFRIIAEYVDEGKSGSKNVEKREAFLRMVHDLSVGKWCGKVVNIGCYDTSRFGRLDTIQGAKYKEQLRNAGVVLRTYADGDYDWRKSFDRIVDSVRSENNHEKSLTVGRTSLRGRIRVTKAGRPNQTTPYGMAKKVTSPTGETIVVKRGQKFSTPKTWKSEFCPGEDAEKEAVQFMYETFDHEDIGYNELARKLTQKGYPSPTGIGWLGETVQDYLTNPVYAGALRIGANPKGAFFRTSKGEVTEKADAMKSDPVIRWDAHEGIIDRKLWDRVQRKAEGKTLKRQPKLRRGPYSLSGVIHCGNCKKSMYGFKFPDGRVAYRCHRVEVGLTNCKYWIAYEQEVLPIIFGKFFADVRAAVEEECNKPKHYPLACPGIPGQKKLRKQLDALEAKLVVARERFLEADKDTAPGLHEALKKWEQERQELLAKLQANEQRDRTSPVLDWWNQFEKEFWAGNPVELPGWAHEIVEEEHGDKTVYLPGDKVKPPKNLKRVSLHWMAEIKEDEIVVLRAKIPASVLRDKLKRLDTEVFVWFVNKSKGRGYDLSKVRVTANVNGELCYEYSSNADS